MKKHYKYIKDYIVQECKYYEFTESPDMEYFPRRELLGYIDAFYDLKLIDDNEEEKIVYIVEKLYDYYKKHRYLFVKERELEELNKYDTVKWDNVKVVDKSSNIKL